MSTSKKRGKSSRRRQPITLDMIDQANVDIDFVESFIDLLSTVSETNQLDAVESASITCMCFHSKIRIAAIKMLIRSISTCDDSGLKTVNNDMIREEIAAYGRNDYGEAQGTRQETMLLLRDSRTPSLCLSITLR